jgi:hypothetical protein
MAGIRPLENGLQIPELSAFPQVAVILTQSGGDYSADCGLSSRGAGQ